MNKTTTGIIVGLLIVIAFVAGLAIRNKHSTNQTSQNPSTTTSSNGRSVDLSGQQLTALPNTLTNQNNISNLNLSNNQLATLPASIGNLTNLEVLNVENNRLETLPPEIGLLTNLKTADFSNNRLTSLPTELGKLTQLKLLNLDGYKGPQSDIDHLKAVLPNTEIR